MRFRNRFVLTVSLFMILILNSVVIDAAQGIVPLPGGKSPAHYLVIQSDASGSLQVIHHQLVNLSGKFQSLTDAQINTRSSASSRMTDTVTVRLLDTSGKVLYQNIQETGN